jgi:hypothetical protein
MKETYIAKIIHSFYGDEEWDNALVISDSMMNLKQELFQELNVQIGQIYEEVPWDDLKFAFDTLDKIIEVGVRTKWFTVEFLKKPSLEVGDLIIVSDHFLEAGEYIPVEPEKGDIGLITDIDNRGWAEITLAKGQGRAPITCLSRHQPSENK